MRSREHYQQNVYPSPFQSRLEPLNKLKQWGRWHDYQSADTFICDSIEYFAVRNSCGVFDMTPMEKQRVTGPDALPYLERLLTRNVEKLRPGRVGYCVWCDDNGRLLDDGTLFHLHEGEYRLCSLYPQLDWMLTNAVGFDVEITRETHEVAALALQGPTSCAVLKRMQLDDIENLKPFGIKHYEFAGVELMVSRTGYTGDLGYELWIDPSAAEALWDRMWDAGSDFGISPMGGNALDLVRIEAGLLLCDADFLPADQTVRPERTRSPYELGLGWLVDLSKPCFNGRQALIEENMLKDETTIGHVTSAMWSPSAKANIALASLQAPYGKVGEEFLAEIYYQRELKWTRVLAPCRVIEGNFFEPPRRRMTPAPDF